MKIVSFCIMFSTYMYTVFLLLKCYAHINETLIYKSPKKMIFTLFSISLAFFINQFYNLNNYKVLISLFIIFILYKYYYNDTVKNCFVSSLIVILFSIVIELFISLLLVVNTSININNSIIIFKILLTIIVYTLLERSFRIDKICIIAKKLKNIMLEFIYLENIILLSFIILNILLYVRSELFNTLYIIIVIAVFLFYIVFTIIVLFKNRYTIKILDVRNKELLKTYNSYSNSIIKYREMKHNLNNELYAIRSIVPKDKVSIINNIIMKYDEQCTWINEIGDIPEGIQGLICIKQAEAERKSIKVIVTYTCKNIIKEKDFLDLSDVLGILLNNSIEASIEAKKGIILVDFNDCGKNIIIKITNIFKNNIDLNAISERNYSTKEIKSGIGLNYVKKLNNKRIKTKLNIINNLFIATTIYAAEGKK